MAKNVDPGRRSIESVNATKARPEPPDVLKKRIVITG